MDTCLRNGVKNNKWQKAPVPASYVLEATAAGAKPKQPKRPGRKPDPTKAPKPQPEPVAEVGEAIAPVPATEATTVKLKPAITKAKASKKAVRHKQSETELLEILQRAGIPV